MKYPLLQNDGHLVIILLLLGQQLKEKHLDETEEAVICNDKSNI